MSDVPNDDEVQEDDLEDTETPDEGAGDPESDPEGIEGASPQPGSETPETGE